MLLLFPGFTAGASLKPEGAFHLLGVLVALPRLYCRGLIEARRQGIIAHMRTFLFPGFTAGASLKPVRKMGQRRTIN